jgi:hypothetical protein
MSCHDFFDINQLKRVVALGMWMCGGGGSCALIFARWLRRQGVQVQGTWVWVLYIEL